MEKLTFEKAKAFTVKKWKLEVKHKGYISYKELRQEAPELNDLKAGCGFCELYRKDGQCLMCPLNINGMSCGDFDHPWWKWAMSRTERNAQRVFDMCINAEEKKS